MQVVPRLDFLSKSLIFSRSMKTKIIFILLFFEQINGAQLENQTDNYLIINKKDVLHKFVHFDPTTDNFVKNVFPDWEDETFNVFDLVKDPEGIAIDLGAWIGTTAIWLSKNFYHVVAVDADPISLKCLKKNAQASECSNITICERPVAQYNQKVIFGARGSSFNESISYIKNSEPSDSNSVDENNIIIRSITFKELIHDYIFNNENIKSHKISFIKCDIEGGEENILEDMLYFAFYNKSKAYISFHLDWWQSKKITDFEYLFKFFKTDCPCDNICEYLKQNPFASLLFEPTANEKLFIKSNIPAVIIAYNQYTYIKNMVEQLEKYTTDIIIIDNNSTYKPLLEYYENDFKYSLLRQKTNLGTFIIEDDFIRSLIGDMYILTDPDIQVNPRLPNNFIQILMDLSFYFKAHKVGFALSIDSQDIRTDILLYGQTIKEWESKFWKNPLTYPVNAGLELYGAPVDTTFCLVNNTFADKENIRIAGDYTCFHLPWHLNFKNLLTDGEYEAYLENNKSTNWF